MNKNLADFYKSWSADRDWLIDYDNEVAVRKVETLQKYLPTINSLKLKSVIDFGCGYGKALERFCQLFSVDKGYGFDISERGIDYAKNHFENARLIYSLLHSLDIGNNISQIRQLVPGDVDAIMLLDVLEHVPDCTNFIKKLALFSNTFIIIVPIESNIIDNYLLRKTYPSSNHYNGHLREFTCNDVHYFIRKIGLTPIEEAVKVYDFRDSYPPQIDKRPSLRKFFKWLLKCLRVMASIILPTRLYLRLVGPGVYCCLARYSEEHTLLP